MLDFTQEETELLVADGYEPGFMMDIRVGDLVAIAPVMRTSFDGAPIPPKTLTVVRIVKQDGSYWQPEREEMVRNTVVNFIGMNLNNLPEHCAYGHTYPCFIKRPT